MAEDKTIIMPDNQNGWGNSFFGNGGFGAGILGGILGGLIPGFFGELGQRLRRFRRR